ncbi:hypothetical protein [Streptomyces sp. NPDC003480]
MLMSVRVGLAAAALISGGSLAAGSADAADVSTTPSAATSASSTQCRDAYVSTSGAWGSARICWTPTSGGYRATAKGTVKDTKGDSKRAALYVSYYTGGRQDSDRIATAHPEGRTAYGSWSRNHVRDVTIYVCTIDRFGTTYNCSRNG